MNMQPIRRSRPTRHPKGPPPRPAASGTARGVPMPGDLMRVERVAAIMCVCRRRVYKMVEEGKLEAIKLGPRTMRILRSSVEAFVKRALREDECGGGGEE